MEMKQRKANRLSDYNYSTNGYYFITICTKEKRCILGNVVGGGVLDAPQLNLSKLGQIAESQLLEMDKIYSNISVDKYIIMPNHVHFIITLSNIQEGASRTPPPTRANEIVPSFVSAFKRFTNKKAGSTIWQRSYYDHVIRNESDYLTIWQYIDTNPTKWDSDEFYIIEELQ